MPSVKRGAVLAAAALALATLALSQKNESQKNAFRYTVGAGASISILNEFGSVSIKPGSGRQVVVVARPHSSKVEVDPDQNGNRVEFRSHLLQPAGPGDGSVDYEVTVPADADVTVRSSDGPIQAEKISGDLALEGDTARVDVRDISHAHVHVRTVNGPINLSNVSNGHVEITSVGGDVTLNAVSGPKVSVNTTKGKIRYTGDMGGGGNYTLANHSGDIEVSLPASASVDLTARSVSGSVENDFPFQPKQHTSMPMAQGRSFSGTSNSGSSSVQLRSFSGKIKVKKQ
jgi:hypothetical protein